MWKVLLVDDEAIVRTGIKMMDGWKEKGFEVVAEAHSGKRALDIYERVRPNLVCTDIKMPGMSGIELLAALREKDPEAYVVMVTHYDDKTTLKEALRLGANDFLSKSEMNAKSLAEVLVRADKYMSSRANIGKRLNQFGEADTISKKAWFLYKWLSNGFIDEKISEHFNQNILAGEKNKNYEFILIYVGCKPSNVTEYMISLISGIASKYGEAVVAYNEYYGVIYILLIRRNHSFNKDVLMNISTDIKNGVQLYTEFEINMGISGVQTDTSKLYLLAEQAEEAHLYATLCNSPVVFFDEIEKDTSVKTGEGADYINRLSLCGYNNLNEAVQICREAALDIQRHKSVARKRMFCSEFCTWFSRVSLNNPQISLPDMQWLLNSYDCDTFLDMLEQSVLTLQDCGPIYRPVNKAIDEVLIYIHKHYDQPITLDKAASLVHLNKNYLSALFSEHVGVSLITYLTKYRVKKAIELLISTDLRVRDIAEKTGFSSERYFSQAFKNIVGQSPANYRSKLKALDK